LEKRVLEMILELFFLDENIVFKRNYIKKDRVRQRCDRAAARAKGI
jgi:hypothetical protein